MPPIRIQLFRPDFGQAEQAALRTVVDSGWVGRGSKTAAFECAFAEHLGVSAECVMAIPSATDGLFLSAIHAKLGVGDEVILPTISYIGAAQAVAATGGTVRLCDVDPRSLNPTAAHLEAARTTRTRAVILIHYGGAPSDMREIMAWAEHNNIIVVEDSACSPISSLDGQACGTFGDFAMWSFDSMKLMSTIEGGALYVRNTELMQTLRRRCTLGMSAPAGHVSSAPERWWEFDVVSAGQRCQFNDAAAVLGLVQLQRLPEMLTTRERIVARYNARLSGVTGLQLPPPLIRGAKHSHYFYWVQLSGARRDSLAVYLRNEGIYTSFRYFPLHRTTLFGSQNTHALPGANFAADNTLNLPCHSLLSDDDVDFVCDALLAFLRRSQPEKLANQGVRPTHKPASAPHILVSLDQL
jgi:aminotransferase